MDLYNTWDLLTLASDRTQTSSALPGELTRRGTLEELRLAHEVARDMWAAGMVEGPSVAQAVVVLAAAIRGAAQRPGREGRA